MIETIVIGVGGAGINILRDMLDQGLQDINTLAVDTFTGTLRDVPASAETCLIGEHGLGMGGNVMMAQQLAQETADKLYQKLVGYKQVWVVASTGGGTGGGIAPVIAHIAKELQIPVGAVVSQPYPFEGGGRYQSSQQAVEALRRVVNPLIAITPERLMKHLPPTPSSELAYSLMQRVMLWHLLAQLI